MIDYSTQETSFKIVLLKYLPDSLFVEDPALIYNKIFIILKPGVVTRLEEASKLKTEISELFDQVFTIEYGNVEGGDILRVKNHFIIGISSRTDEVGANNLSKIIIIPILVLYSFTFTVPFCCKTKPKFNYIKLID